MTHAIILWKGIATVGSAFCTIMWANVASKLCIGSLDGLSGRYLVAQYTD